MPARDVDRDAVKSALVKDGWRITADPYKIKDEDANLGICEKIIYQS